MSRRFSKHAVFSPEPRFKTVAVPRRGFSLAFPRFARCSIFFRFGETRRKLRRASVRESSRHTQSSSHLRQPAPTPATTSCFIDFTTRITMRIFPRREYEPTVKYVAASHCVGVSHRRETCFLNSVSSNFTRTKIPKVSAEKKESKEK